MRINEEKYINLIMYILFKCLNKPNLGKTVLCTVMYFIDFNYYELYGDFLTKETYIKSRKGIKPKHFKEITQSIPSLKFTPQELRVINSSIRKLSDSNATSITRFAWHDKPLVNTELGDEINYNDVFLR